MDSVYMASMAEAGIALTDLALKGTASEVNKKIATIKEERNAEKIRNTYDEIINELLSEKDEAVRIAQIYKSEIERIVISDEDINHLHNTVDHLLDAIKHFMPPEQVEAISIIRDLISVDTLKAMQLLGFNYKEAIGEPLTQLCAKSISSLGGNPPKTQQKKK